MTTIEIAFKSIESTDFRNVELKTGDIFSANGKKEIVTQTHYDEKRLTGFRTLRREEGAILESGYSVGNATGKLEKLSSGIHFEKENPPFHASGRYFELNKILEEQEK